MTPVEALERIAELLMRGRAPAYRQQAFKRAAREISRVPEAELQRLAEAGRLTDIPNVGEKTASRDCRGAAGRDAEVPRGSAR